MPLRPASLPQLNRSLEMIVRFRRDIRASGTDWVVMPLHLLGNALFKRTIYGRLPLSHLGGLALRALLPMLTAAMPLWTHLALSPATPAIAITVAAWETVSLKTPVAVHRVRNSHCICTPSVIPDNLAALRAVRDFRYGNCGLQPSQIILHRPKHY